MTTKQLLLDKKYTEFVLASNMDLNQITTDLQWLHWFSGKPDTDAYIMGVAYALVRVCKSSVVLDKLCAYRFVISHDKVIVDKLIQYVSSFSKRTKEETKC